MAKKGTKGISPKKGNNGLKDPGKTTSGNMPKPKATKGAKCG